MRLLTREPESHLVGLRLKILREPLVSVGSRGRGDGLNDLPVESEMPKE